MTAMGVGGSGGFLGSVLVQIDDAYVVSCVGYHGSKKQFVSMCVSNLEFCT